MKRRGGFRTRYRIQWARLIWATLREHVHVATVRGTMGICWEYQQTHDRQRVCPHPLDCRWSPVKGFIDCEACGCCLKNQEGWLVDVPPSTDDGLSWERKYAPDSPRLQECEA